MTFAPGIPDFDIDTLDLLHRVLVTTDGTVTDMLAAAFLEEIELVKLSVTISPSARPVPALELDAGAMLMHRLIALRGASSGTRYAHAEVLIAADALAPDFRRDLIEGRVPLGELWLRHKLETWKERPRVRERTADDVAEPLELDPDELIIERTYRTFTGGRPVFQVTEYFPTRFPRQVPDASPLPPA